MEHQLILLEIQKIFIVTYYLIRGQSNADFLP